MFVKSRLTPKAAMHGLNTDAGCGFSPPPGITIILRCITIRTVFSRGICGARNYYDGKKEKSVALEYPVVLRAMTGC